MAVYAIFDQEIENDYIEQACNQARRVGVEANRPIQVDSDNMGDKPCHEYNWKDNPMATKIVKENVADCDGYNKSSIEPKEHPYMIRRPEIIRYPFHKATIEQRLIKYMNDIRCEKCPEEDV
ncbi:MAG TPA: hypothetical protein VN721_05145 [Flavipsychrobacter sp.]|nr:hypothetical protein [Flavipsychrobacter sp.]